MAEAADTLDIGDVDRVGCIGDGRAGILSMLALASVWHNKTFVILDSNAHVINDLNGLNHDHMMRFPFEEPNIDELLNENPGLPNVVFSSDIAGQLLHCNVVFIAVNVPSANNPKQIKRDLDTRNLEEAVAAVLRSMNANGADKYIALKSTISVDYEGKFYNRLRRYPNFDRLNIIVNPEFFSTATAVNDVTHPERIVLGQFHRGGLQLFHQLYGALVPNQFFRIQVLQSIRSAEIGKLMSNAMAAAQITINNIGSTVCEKVGGDFSDAIRCLNSNRKQLTTMTRSRIGYGGSGLVKDLAYLAYLCNNLGMKQKRDFVTSIIKARVSHMDEFVEKVLSTTGTVKRIGIFGFSSIVGTDEIRESPALYICTEILKAWNNRIIIYDPVVRPQIIMASFMEKYRARIETADHFFQAVHQAQVLIFLNEAPEFIDMVANHPVQMLYWMREPKHIFDCCDLVENMNANVINYIMNRANLYQLGK